MTRIAGSVRGCWETQMKRCSLMGYFRRRAGFCFGMRVGVNFVQVMAAKTSSNFNSLDVRRESIQNIR